MQFQKCLPIVLSAFLLCGCAKAMPPAPEAAAAASPLVESTSAPSVTAPASTDFPLSPGNQLSLIYENIDTWRALDETDAWSYAVTDLDGNGRLEILSSETHGTGHIPTFRAWEVDESGTSIVSIAEPDEQGSTVIMGASSYNAEYLSMDTVDKFFDSANSRSYYIQTSEVKDGAAHYRETKFAISLENGKMEQDILGFKQTEYLDGGAKSVAAYQGTDGAVISEEEYAFPAQLSGLEHTAAHIGWLLCVHAQDMTQALLSESWQAFCS